MKRKRNQELEKPGQNEKSRFLTHFQKGNRNDSSDLKEM